MEYISVIISVLSLGLSIALAIRTYIKELESYSADIIDYRSFKPNRSFYSALATIHPIH